MELFEQSKTRCGSLEKFGKPVRYDAGEAGPNASLGSE